MSDTQATADPVVSGYATAIFQVARAEDALERVEDELYQFARALESNPDLREKLTDPSIETGAKIGLVTDLLGGRAHPQTVSALTYIVQAGRARQLPQIADAVVAHAAESRKHAVAEVRSAVALGDEQRRKLAEALAKIAGKQVDLKVTTDPDVVGGLVARVGDTVIDGSVARRLSELRAHLTGG